MQPVLNELAARFGRRTASGSTSPATSVAAARPLTPMALSPPSSNSNAMVLTGNNNSNNVGGVVSTLALSPSAVSRQRQIALAAAAATAANEAFLALAPPASPLPLTPNSSSSAQLPSYAALTFEALSRHGGPNNSANIRSHDRNNTNNDDDDDDDDIVSFLESEAMMPPASSNNISEGREVNYVREREIDLYASQYPQLHRWVITNVLSEIADEGQRDQRLQQLQRLATISQLLATSRLSREAAEQTAAQATRMGRGLSQQQQQQQQKQQQPQPVLITLTEPLSSANSNPQQQNQQAATAPTATTPSASTTATAASTSSIRRFTSQNVSVAVNQGAFVQELQARLAARATSSSLSSATAAAASSTGSSAGRNAREQLQQQQQQQQHQDELDRLAARFPGESRVVLTRILLEERDPAVRESRLVARAQTRSFLNSTQPLRSAPVHMAVMSQISSSAVRDRFRWPTDFVFQDPAVRAREQRLYRMRMDVDRHVQMFPAVSREEICDILRDELDDERRVERLERLTRFRATSLLAEERQMQKKMQQQQEEASGEKMMKQNQQRKEQQELGRLSCCERNHHSLLERDVPLGFHCVLCRELLRLQLAAEVANAKLKAALKITNASSGGGGQSSAAVAAGAAAAAAATSSGAPSSTTATARLNLCSGHHSLLRAAQSSVNSAEPKSSVPKCETPKQSTCVICLSEPPTHAIIGCGHRCVCDLCAGLGLSTCPVCRAPATSVLRIYDV